MSDPLDEMVAENQAAGEYDTLPQALVRIQQLRIRIAELDAIVAKLPKTADGVPVVPFITPIYHPSEPNRALYVVGSNMQWAYKSSSRLGGFAATRDCYSTPEAAEQAKGGE